MKILFLINSLLKGGKERQLLELIKILSKNNKDIIMEIVLMNKKIEYDIHLDARIKINYLIRKNKRDISNFLKLFQICNRFKPDIVHSWSNLFTLFAIPSTKLNGIKLIDGSIRYAAPIKFFSKIGLISKMNFLFSNRIIANSYAGLKAHKIKENDKQICIHNGFDFLRIKNISKKKLIREKYHIRTQYIIGMVARFSDLKDYNLYIKVALKILQIRNDITFLCVGKGPNQKKVESMVSNDTKRHILFTGNIDNIEDVINIFDICILTNNINGHAEGISNSIMEYMALEKPVIATCAGGNKELIIDNVTGFLINPFDFIDLKEKIEILLNDEKLRLKMGRLGRERIENSFSSSLMVNKYINLYRGLLNEN